MLSRLFRAKFIAYLKFAFRRGDLGFHGVLRSLGDKRNFAQWLKHVAGTEWVVYAKPPFGGPRQVLKYLARYTHRVAISNQRLVSLESGRVTFRWKNYARASESAITTLPAAEFIRRSLLHVLPNGFVRVRHFGFLANRVGRQWTGWAFRGAFELDLFVCVVIRRFSCYTEHGRQYGPEPGPDGRLSKVRRPNDSFKILAAKTCFCLLLIWPIVLFGPCKVMAQNTAVGNGALADNTTGTGNSAFGAFALFNNTTGFNNTSVGEKSLMSNISGNENIAIGVKALMSNIRGNGNIATGNNALLSNTTGGDNIGIGNETLSQNTTGYGNCAIGTGTLEANTMGIGNTAIGAPAMGANTTGESNTAIGVGTLFYNRTGSNNTASGVGALFNNTTADDNTAVGADALMSNTTGAHNTAVGFDALHSNTTADDNTAGGFGALASNTTGIDNTASGKDALSKNTTGGDNTADGFEALLSNSDGAYNTADGVNALLSNTDGSYNTATGVSALAANITGSSNSATGFYALNANTTGQQNTALGRDALYSNTIGSGNIAIGYQAGYRLITGDHNVDIGNPGDAADSNTVRVGEGQSTTYVAGIFGTAMVQGDPVMVSATGQLGILVSSSRYKRDIRTMGERSQGLLKLRPVTFRYKQDPRGERQYGLIAEEVARVYPELVGYGSDGKVQTVRYQELIPMLLNELQKQDRKNQKQQEQLYRQAKQIQSLTEQSEDQAAYNRRLSAQVARLEGLFEQATTAQRGTGNLAAAFNR